MRARHRIGAPLFVSRKMSIFELSCDKSNRRNHESSPGFAGDHEIREVLEHPVVLERFEDDARELLGQRDDRLALAAISRDPMIEPLQVFAVPQRDQRALHQRGAAQFRAAFGDPAGVFRFVRVAHPGYIPK